MRKLQYLFMTLAALFMASPAFAQASAAAAPHRAGCRSAPASAWPSLPASADSDRAAPPASATEALARNPGARAGILTMLLLGLAFMESLALFTLLIVFAVGEVDFRDGHEKLPAAYSRQGVSVCRRLVLTAANRLEVIRQIREPLVLLHVGRRAAPVERAERGTPNRHVLRTVRGGLPFQTAERNRCERRGTCRHCPWPAAPGWWA